ncbi:MAG: HAD-IA family hydrolase [Planctomycetaceae bacterium]
MAARSRGVLRGGRDTERRPHGIIRAASPDGRRAAGEREDGVFSMTSPDSGPTVDAAAEHLAADVTRGKPHPEIYETAAARLGVHPARMLVLEDSAAGCRAAGAAGAVSVAVPGGHRRRHDFSGVRFGAESLADPRSGAPLPPGGAP